MIICSILSLFSERFHHLGGTRPCTVKFLLLNCLEKRSKETLHYNVVAMQLTVCERGEHLVCVNANIQCTKQLEPKQCDEIS